MPFLRANGVALHFEDLGGPARPVLVFSNSLGTDFRIWQADASLDGVVALLLADFGRKNIDITVSALNAKLEELRPVARAEVLS